MVFKLIITGISSFSLGLVIGILIVYFLVGKTFFSFMKIDRMNMCSEMESNSNEVREELDSKVKESIEDQNLLEDKEEFFDGNEE